MRKGSTSVIPSAAMDLVFSATYEEEISRLHLERIVATQSVGRDGIANYRTDFGDQEKYGCERDWIVSTCSHRLMMATAKRTMAEN
jgi:hypothetical protein